MRRMKRLWLLMSLASSAALARSEQPVIAPAPDWVKPLALPAMPASDDEAPVRVLLADQQTRMEVGRVSTYVDLALHIQTPQGLAAGNLSFPWDPETAELTVHKLLIHREGKAIDVLEAGQTFTVVRREPNLESATLDGMLTANIQPEGLQVGDVLEYAVTMTSSDPVFKGHVEQVGGTWNGVPFIKAHLRVQWPSSMPVTIRQNGGLPPVKPVKSGNMTSVELSLDNLQPAIPPRLAPLRYAMGRVVEFSDFKSWAEVGALMAPLYADTSVIPAQGALRNELEKIKAASTDPVKRTEAALTLVQDRVRYVALLMGSGGYEPARAEETWARRYGDCKAKSALLLGLLRELGIDAEPVAANAISGDGIDQRQPMIGLFNHVLVRARIDGKTYWLDGTRTGDTSLARLSVPDFGWGLPLVARDAALVRMLPSPLDTPNYDLAIDIDAREGLATPAGVKGVVTLRGDEATQTRLALAGMTAEARDAALRAYWKDRLDDLEIAKVTATFDNAAGAEMLAMEGKLEMDWDDGQYWTDWTRVGYEADFSRTEGTNKEAPFAIGYPSYSRTVQTIQLPPGFTDRNIFRPDPIDETVGGIEYRRRSSLTDNRFRIERTVRAVVPEIAAADAPAAQKRLKELYQLPVSVRRPAGYRPTEAELALLMKEEPKTAAAFIRRGNDLMDNGRHADALVDFGDALELEPKNALAMANRGVANVWLDQFDAARKDLDAATALDPKLAVIQRARGLMGQREGDNKAAVAAYSRALQMDAADNFARGHRAEAYHALGEHDAALADLDAAIKADPQWVTLRVIRMEIYRIQGRTEDALSDVESYLASDPDNVMNQVRTAQLYALLKRRDLGLGLIDKALATQPVAYFHVLRARMQEKSAFAERAADYEAALKMEPDQRDALMGKAELEMERGNPPGAIAIYSSMLARKPGEVGLMSARGIAYAKAGDAAKASQDFEAARQKAVSDAGMLNDLCWAKATENVALATALTECDASLARVEQAASLDSRAFVLLRMGRFDDAIATYDKALAKASRQAASLYGRAIAWARRGDKAKADADRASALRIDPGIEDQFAGYGVKIDP